MIIYVDIDGTICKSEKTYIDSYPIISNIDKINKLFDNGHTIIYWTARGNQSNIDWTELTEKQLKDWNCKYTKLVMNKKPSYDLLIDDKTKRIEEL